MVAERECHGRQCLNLELPMAGTRVTCGVDRTCLVRFGRLGGSTMSLAGRDRLPRAMLTRHVPESAVSPEQSVSPMRYALQGDSSSVVDGTAKELEVSVLESATAKLQTERAGTSLEEVTTSLATLNTSDSHERSVVTLVFLAGEGWRRPCTAHEEIRSLARHSTCVMNSGLKCRYWPAGDLVLEGLCQMAHRLRQYMFNFQKSLLVLVHHNTTSLKTIVWWFVITDPSRNHIARRASTSHGCKSPATSTTFKTTSIVHLVHSRPAFALMAGSVWTIPWDLLADTARALALTHHGLGKAGKPEDTVSLEAAAEAMKRGAERARACKGMLAERPRHVCALEGGDQKVYQVMPSLSYFRF